MPEITLGHRLTRELARIGERKRCFRTDQYRILRKIDSIEELAEFFDRSGCKHVPVSDNVTEMATAIAIERDAPDGLRDPAMWSLGSFIFGAWMLLSLPIALLWHVMWRERGDDANSHENGDDRS